MPYTGPIPNTVDRTVEQLYDPGWGPVGPQIVMRASDSAARASLIVPADDDTLLFPVLANATYFVEAYLRVDAANGTMDIMVGWNYPASASARWGGNAAISSSLGTWQVGAAATVPPALNGISDQPVYGTRTGVSGVSLAGTFTTVATAGTLTLQWSQGTSDLGNLVLSTGSMIRYQRAR